MAASSPRRQVFLVGLIVCATLAVGVVVAAVARPEPQSRDVPVILVHGMGGTPANMSPVARRLQRDGRRTVSVALPRRGLGPISTSARAVDDAVRRSGAERVDLVGYSLGGVVVRYWAAELDDDGRARRVVTLGSPHHGAQLADDAAAIDPTLCRDACGELRSGSAFLRELNAEDESPGDAQWVAVYTTLDLTVVPVESARLDGAVNVLLQDVCIDSRVGHGSLVTDPLPVGIIVLALAGNLDAQPLATDCANVRALGR